MTRNALKWIALITMTIDHIGFFLLSPDETPYLITRMIGRIAFPLFAFMIAEGFLHTSNLKKYIVRLLTLGIITELIFLLIYFIDGYNLTHLWFLEGPGIRMNIVWTLLLGLIGLTLLRKYESFNILIITLLFLVSLVLPYDFYGLGLILIFGITSSSHQKWTYTAAITLLYCFYPAIELGWSGINWVQLFALLTIPLLMLYQGKRGRGSMRYTYWYYPIHIVIIYIIQMML